MSDSRISRIVLEVASEIEALQPENLLVAELHGVEAISSLYDFDLTVHCQQPGGLDPETIDDLLDTTVSVTFGPDSARRVSGVISHVELLSWGQGTNDARDAVYHFELVPRLWRFQMTHRSRCFVGKSIPAIFEIILGDYGMAAGRDYSLRLDRAYPDNADRHVVQFEETDFAFMSRWMERLGIYYFFEQESDREVLVITDSRSKLTEAEHYENAYSQDEGLDIPGRVGSMVVRTHARPRNVHVRDFNWGNNKGKTSIVIGDAPVNPGEKLTDPPEERTGHGFQCHYGDHFLTDEEGARMAAIRAEGWMVRKRVYHASSANHDWWPGQRFVLQDPPGMPELENEYLITSIAHQASAGIGGGDYSNSFEAVEYAYEYRPPMRTPWPRIEGVINARIDDGEIDSGAPIDERGFYRVILPYDYYGHVGEKPTAWIRKAEAYAGIDHGAHFTLHSGAEVLLAHVNGDPDRPIIVGAVPNASRPSPVSGAESTRHIVRTRSGIVLDFQDDAT